MDVGVYVTSLRSLKNLLLVGDVVKSVWFVAFQVRLSALQPSMPLHHVSHHCDPLQEDPYKMVVLGKDVRVLTAMTADFLFADSKLGIVTGDEEGVLRVYEFDPTGTFLHSLPGADTCLLTPFIDPDSKSGQYLLCRTEFHTQSETRVGATVTMARRVKEEDMATPQSRLLFGRTFVFL